MEYNQLMGLASSIPSSAIALSSVFIVRCRQGMALKLRYGHQGRNRYGGEKNEFEALRCKIGVGL